MKITQKHGRVVSPPVFSSKTPNYISRNAQMRPQAVKLELSQSDTYRPRNNSGKGCHQTDTLLGKMKITQKRAELFHP